MVVVSSRHGGAKRAALHTNHTCLNVGPLDSGRIVEGSAAPQGVAISEGIGCWLVT